MDVGAVPTVAAPGLGQTEAITAAEDARRAWPLVMADGVVAMAVSPFIFVPHIFLIPSLQSTILWWILISGALLLVTSLRTSGTRIPAALAAATAALSGLIALGEALEVDGLHDILNPLPAGSYPILLFTLPLLTRSAYSFMRGRAIRGTAGSWHLYVVGALCVVLVFLTTGEPPDYRFKDLWRTIELFTLMALGICEVIGASQSERAPVRVSRDRLGSAADAPPDSYTGIAVVALVVGLVFGGLVLGWLGIVAMIRSSQASSKSAVGDISAASRASDAALTWSLLQFGFAAAMAGFVLLTVTVFLPYMRT